MILDVTKDVDSRIVFLILHLACLEGRFHDDFTCVRTCLLVRMHSPRLLGFDK